MAVSAQLAPKIVLDELPIEAWTHGLHTRLKAETKDATTFGTVPYRAAVAGLRSMTIEVAAFNDYAIAAIDEWARANYGTLLPAVTVVPLGDAVGNLAVFTRGLLKGYQPENAKVGDIPKMTFDIQPAGAPIVEGLVTQPSTSTLTVTGHTTPEQVGAITAGQTMWAAIHVIAISGTATPTATFQLESAATSGGAYTLRGTPSAGLTAIGGVLISSTTVTTDTWWKLAVTITGTSPVFTVLASIARQS
jgi:hypothetical protein